MHKDGIRSGYLNSDFRLFHLKDKTKKEFDYHYHEFNKIIIFLSGNVTYIIEGRTYHLKPYDILLVNNHDIHKPIIDSNSTYERIVIWADTNFVKEHSDDNCNLEECFKYAIKNDINLIRLKPDLQNELISLLTKLEASINSQEFGSRILSNAYLIEFLVYINRLILGNNNIIEANECDSIYDNQINEILKYINANLNEPLTVDDIANRFYISRYYLMHRFKEQTGYTLHNYISQKRLILAKELLLNNESVMKVSEKCGFIDYSSFLRSFRKMYGTTPKDFSKKAKSDEPE
ncbi:MAG: AraC family transcriptional regulator [Lachnospiraceae bacterium]|uniref:AraC family transcriptional regulator n=1 Tax=Falcatimonas sp. MSJ-15 TaxID=2841515 RepID=UPI001C120AB8|nr:AraC family transcriptional regulator [Falcatimonas sp. MSJ-15]MBU5470230.1 AraC family transcriptional regulator [Falcatimonas sp. MSJ-15]MEE0960892.1 AraC family transcriptional regulator [Lachnospiraceae bacterium]